MELPPIPFSHNTPAETGLLCCPLTIQRHAPHPIHSRCPGSDRSGHWEGADKEPPSEEALLNHLTMLPFFSKAHILLC